MAAKPALGLYLTDQFIQLARVSADGKTLTSFLETPLTAGVIVNGEIRNRPELIRQLQAALNKISASEGESTVLGISVNRTFLREFTIPKLPGRDIEDAIDWQVRSLLPVLPAEVETDWKIIGKDANDQVEVLLAAIPKTIVDSYVKAAVDAGLKVIDLEPAAFADVRVIDPATFKGKNQLLVHLTPSFAEISYLTNAQPRISDYLISGEVSKRGTIAKVITDYIGFVNSKHPYRPVTEVILSGDHPEIASVATQLKERNILAHIAEARLKSASEKGSTISTAAGLSLKPFTDGESLKLLPLVLRLQEKTDRLQSLWQALLVILIFASSMLTGWLLLTFISLQSRITNLTVTKEQQLIALPAEDKAVLTTNIKALNTLTSRLLAVTGVTGGEDRLLTELSSATPNSVKYTSLLYTRDPKSMLLSDPLSSWIVTGQAESRPLVLDLYDRLLGQPSFPNAKLYYGSLEKEAAVDFRIAGTPAPR